jgi:general secretion pathway protein G
MVVLVIVGLVAGLITVSVTGRLGKAKRSAAEVEIRSLMKEVDLYFIDEGRYPTTAEGLQTAIAAGQAEGTAAAPVDPWGNAYLYTSPGLRAPYEIVSFGADGREGGSGADADIQSWDLERESGG